MAPGDIEKTDSTSLGLYQFTVMPFGLTNPPSTFLRLREDVLRGLQLEECLLYLDDIIVPGSTFEFQPSRESIFFTTEGGKFNIGTKQMHFQSPNQF